MKPSLRMEHRRSHVRFEVLGTMSGSILSTEMLRVVNLGTNGALVEAALPLPLNAEYQMQLVLESYVAEVTVKVRRVGMSAQSSGSLCYQIGLEFLTVAPETAEVLSQIMAANQTQV